MSSNVKCQMKPVRGFIKMKYSEICEQNTRAALPLHLIMEHNPCTQSAMFSFDNLECQIKSKV